MRGKIKRSSGFYVYILRCSDGTLYTGYTNNIQERLKLHNNGRGARYTKGRRPLKLVYLKEYRYYKHAVSEEMRLKSLPKSEKEKLVKSKRRRK